MSGADLAEAEARVRAGGLVAYPTETEWGLGADATSPAAVERLFAFKQRGPGQPVSLLLAGTEDAARVGIALDARARRLAERFWPGPLTLVVPGGARLAPGVARADGAVGLRCSPHPVAAALARRLAAADVGPLTATSLNRSGEPGARTRAQAERACARVPDAERPLCLEGADAGGGAPSTVVDLCGARPDVLRWGALARERLDPVLGELPA